MPLLPLLRDSLQRKLLVLRGCPLCLAECDIIEYLWIFNAITFKQFLNRTNLKLWIGRVRNMKPVELPCCRRFLKHRLGWRVQCDKDTNHSILVLDNRFQFPYVFDRNLPTFDLNDNLPGQRLFRVIWVNVLIIDYAVYALVCSLLFALIRSCPNQTQCPPLELIPVLIG